MEHFYTILNERMEAIISLRYKTARAAKIAASRLGYNSICRVSEVIYCFDIETKVNGKWVTGYEVI
jgi:hypothetical protein